MSPSPSVPKEENTSDATQPKESVRLVSSALFFTASNPVPKGIRARDMSAMVQGLVEEHAPLPLEQASWGFILDNKGQNNSHFLYYAAPKDLIFTRSSDAEDMESGIAIPGIAALSGLHFKKTTWLCLLEENCLSLIRFAADSTVPDQLHARFLDAQTDSAACLALREELLTQKVDSKKDKVISGFIRIERTTAKAGKGLQFALSRSTDPATAWKSWKSTSISQPTRLLAADVRDKATLEARHKKSQAGKRILWVAGFVIFAILILTIFEYLQIRQQTEAENLSEQAEQQRPMVERLKEIESMNKSLKNVFQKDFQPFQWMMAINQSRPELVSFSSYTISDAGSFTVNGEATEVKSLNTYVENLQANPKLESVEMVSLNTSNEGVTFSLKFVGGDLAAEIPLETETLTEAPAPDEASVDVENTAEDAKGTESEAESNASEATSSENTSTEPETSESAPASEEN